MPAVTVAPMCGIVGYVGHQGAQDVVVEGLRRLEYRGYDSAGIALVADGELVTDKRAGKLANLEKAIADTPLPGATIGMGHTRWATHGAPTDVNAHPHTGETRRVALVHNGIIENFAELRAGLEAADHRLLSETDTEVAAQLLELEVLAGADLTTAMLALVRRLEGAFTLVAVDAEDPERVVAARRNSPLVVGIGEGENFLGSDVAAFIEHTREALELGQDQVVTISRDGVEVANFDGSPATGRRYHVDWDLSAARAITVLRRLNELDGIPSSRLHATAFGHEKPLIDPSEPGSQEINKRVDIIIVSSLPPESQALLGQVVKDRARSAEGVTTP